MALQGNIDSFSIVDVLRLLGASAKTGRLVVEGDRGRVAIWLLHGGVATAAVTPTGQTSVTVTAVDALADVLRLTEGEFVFEADVMPAVTDSAPVEVEGAIADAQAALSEWFELVAVVPSLDAPLALAAELPGDVVEVDRRSWSGISAIAAAGGPLGATVGDVARRGGLSEMDALRLARDLAVAGLIEIGPVAAADERVPTASVAVSPEPVSSEPVLSEPAFVEPVSTEPAFVEPVSTEPASTEPVSTEALLTEPVSTEALPTGPVSTEPVSTEPVSTEEPVDRWAGPFGPSAFDAPTAFDPHPEGTAIAESGDASGDEAAQQADFARQLAMLSPRAAEAVALAEAGPISEEEERARVARFLGSV